jgi:DHA1 family inner membrane transport protein
MTETQTTTTRFASASVLVLALTTGLTATNMAALGAFIPTISDEMHVSVPLLGQVTTAVFVLGAGFSLFSGPLADHIGKRRVIFIGLATLIISAAGTALAPSFGWLLATRLISAFSGGAVIGSALAMAGGAFTGDERRRAISWISTGTASAAIAGIPLMALLASATSWRVAYSVVAGLGLLWFMLILRLIPDDATHTRQPFRIAQILAAYRPLVGARPMHTLFLASLLRAISWVGVLTYLGAFFADQFGMSTGEIGWTYMVGGTAYFGGTKLSGGNLAGLEPRNAFALSVFAMGGLLCLTMLLPLNPFFSIGLLALAAVGGGVSWVLLVTLLASETPAGQGTTMALNSGVFSLGSALGGAAGGGLLALGAYPVMALGLAGFAVVATALVWLPSTALLPRRAAESASTKEGALP